MDLQEEVHFWASADSTHTLDLSGNLRPSSLFSVHVNLAIVSRALNYDAWEIAVSIKDNALTLPSGFRFRLLSWALLMLHTLLSRYINL